MASCYPTLLLLKPQHVRAVTGRSLADAKAHVEQMEKKNNP
jgi:ribosomal protein L7/L12